MEEDKNNAVFTQESEKPESDKICCDNDINDKTSNNNNDKEKIESEESEKAEEAEEAEKVEETKEGEEAEKSEEAEEAEESESDEINYNIDEKINSIIEIWKGDITTLKVDAIVNAANSALYPGGGVCGAIHSRAGKELAKECRKIGHCETGDAVITNGYKLPAKHVIHTVGPTDGDGEKLESCYIRCLEVLVENELRSIVSENIIK